MKRRDFMLVFAAGAAAARPLAARAQQPGRVYRLAVVHAAQPVEAVSIPMVHVGLDPIQWGLTTNLAHAAG